MNPQGSGDLQTAEIQAAGTCRSNLKSDIWRLVRFTVLLDLGRVDAERVGQVLQMFLFLRDDFAQHFAERELAHGVGLANALAVIG